MSFKVCIPIPIYEDEPLFHLDFCSDGSGILSDSSGEFVLHFKHDFETRPLEDLPNNFNKKSEIKLLFLNSNYKQFKQCLNILAYLSNKLQYSRYISYEYNKGKITSNIKENNSIYSIFKKVITLLEPIGFCLIKDTNSIFYFSHKKTFLSYPQIEKQYPSARERLKLQSHLNQILAEFI